MGGDLRHGADVDRACDDLGARRRFQRFQQRVEAGAFRQAGDRRPTVGPPEHGGGDGSAPLVEPWSRQPMSIRWRGRSRRRNGKCALTGSALLDTAPTMVHAERTAKMGSGGL